MGMMAKQIVLYWEEITTLKRFPPLYLLAKDKEKEYKQWKKMMRNKGWYEVQGFKYNYMIKKIKIVRRHRLKLNSNEDPAKKVKAWEHQTGRKVIKWKAI